MYYYSLKCSSIILLGYQRLIAYLLIQFMWIVPDSTHPLNSIFAAIQRYLSQGLMSWAEHSVYHATVVSLMTYLKKITRLHVDRTIIVQGSTQTCIMVHRTDT